MALKKEPGVLVCIGTRPEIIKMAPVYHALREANLATSVLHTGQHEDMAWPLYEFFGITPDKTIRLKRRSVNLVHLGALLLVSLDAALTQLKPALVLVQGDTSSALNAALAAFYHKIPIGHVEAGLRSHAVYDPFPEEKNRELIGRLALLHFAPTIGAQGNLLAEGIPKGQIFMVGNTVVDAAYWGAERLEQLSETGAEILPDQIRELRSMKRGSKLLLVTAHRRENWEHGIALIAMAIKELLVRDSQFVAVWPMHPNQAVRSTIHEVFAGLEGTARSRLYLCEPFSYPALLWVLKRCWLVMTDSGGIQEEAAAFSKPVFVLRDTTERQELISAGGGILVGVDSTNIVTRVGELLGDSARYQQMCKAVNLFGDGRAAKYIAKIIDGYLRPDAADAALNASAATESVPC